MTANITETSALVVCISTHQKGVYYYNQNDLRLQGCVEFQAIATRWLALHQGLTLEVVAHLVGTATATLTWRPAPATHA